MMFQSQKPGRATALFRGGRVGPTDTKWILLLGIKGKDLFDPNFVLPLVEEVVFVEKSLPRTKLEMMQQNFLSPILKPRAFQASNPIPFAPNAKLMEIIIRPVHHDLQEIV